MRPWMQRLSRNRAWMAVGLPLAAASVYGLPLLAQTLETIPNGIINTANSRGTTPGGVGVSSVSNPAVVGVGELQLVKTGDRGAAEPGDTVVYRLLFRTNGQTTLAGIQDQLPRGVNVKTASLQAFLRRGTNRQALRFQTINVQGRQLTATFDTPVILQSGDTVDVVYAAEVTPDAVRGNGRNTAVGINNFGGPATNTSSHVLRIRPGILSDCGTLLGRVFVDKNRDGEQQPGEPGIPYAVVFLDDGNRITSDENGLFSVANVIQGYRVGTIDLSSVPGYRLTNNEVFIERNSVSRLVRLAPGTTARMNFGLEPYEIDKEVVIERRVEVPVKPEPKPAPAPKPAPVQTKPKPVPALF